MELRRGSWDIVVSVSISRCDDDDHDDEDRVATQINNFTTMLKAFAISGVHMCRHRIGQEQEDESRTSRELNEKKEDLFIYFKLMD